MDEKTARELLKVMKKLTEAVEDSNKLTRATLKAAGVKSPSAPPPPQQPEQPLGAGGPFVDPLTQFLGDRR